MTHKPSVTSKWKPFMGFFWFNNHPGSSYKSIFNKRLLKQVDSAFGAQSLLSYSWGSLLISSTK